MSLVVHYMFNEIVNGKIPDVSGNGNDFPISDSSECYLVDNIDTKNTTKYSKCLYSANGLIGVLNKKEYFISEKTGTVSLFVKNDDNDYSNLLYTYSNPNGFGIPTLLVTRPEPNVGVESAFLITNDKSVGCGTICFGKYSTNKDYVTSGQFSGFVSNKFNHLAFTYDKTNLKFLIYVNGILFLNVPASSIFFINKCRTLGLGCSKSAEGKPYEAKPGYWSDFRYYDNVLTAQEIKKIYDDYYTAPQKPASFKITKASQMISNEFIERTPNTNTKISIYENYIKCAELIENLNQNVPKMTKTGNLMCKEFVEKA